MAVRLSQPMSWLNYHHLYYFYSIATLGGIARAAEHLNVGQPTLSLQLKQLEESVGSPLFERKNRTLVLTEAGRVALEYASEIFRLGSEMVDALQDRQVLSRVNVQIGALDSVPKPVLEKIVLKAYALGNCKVSLLEGNGDELFNDLREHRLDLLITNFPVGVGKERVYAKSIGRFAVQICASPSKLSLRKNFPQSLNGEKLILPTTHSRLRAEIDQFLVAHQLKTEVIAETQDTSLQTQLGISGAGLVPLSTLASQQLIKEKKLVSIGALQGIEEEIWLCSATRRVSNPIASKLMNDLSPHDLINNQKSLPKSL